jgi:hypothetical protein
MCVFQHRWQCPGCGQRRQVKKAAKKGSVGAGPWGKLSRGVALFCQRTADVLAGVDHVIRLGLAGGVAAIVTAASRENALRTPGDKLSIFRRCEFIAAPGVKPCQGAEQKILLRFNG